jgi:outer membrane protein
MNNINKIVGLSIVALFGVLILNGLLVPSASGEDLGKVGIVDVLKVYNDWDVQKKADAEFQPKRQDLETKDQDISKMKKSLQTQKSVWAAEKIAKQEAEIKTAERDLRDQVESLSEEIDKKAKELTKELDGKLQKIYKDLAEKEGYTLILEKRAVRYNKPEMDLTKKITELLNKMESATAPAESEKTTPGVKSEPSSSVTTPSNIPKKAK